MDNLIPLPSDPASSCHHYIKDQQPRCRFCGRYFNPDHRQGARQKSCTRSDCKKLRKREAQQEWLAKNPAYFSGHYADAVKSWREANPGYQKIRRARIRRGLQDAMTANSSIITMHLAITPRDWREIKDTIARQMPNRRGFVVYGRVLARDKRHDRLANAQQTRVCRLRTRLGVR